LKIFENKVLRIFGPKTAEVTEAGEHCIMRSCIVYTHHPNPIVRMIKSRRKRQAGHVTYTGQMKNA
jgi:hypothetical protein